LPPEEAAVEPLLQVVWDRLTPPPKVELPQVVRRVLGVMEEVVVEHKVLDMVVQVVQVFTLRELMHLAVRSAGLMVRHLPVDPRRMAVLEGSEEAEELVITAGAGAVDIMAEEEEGRQAVVAVAEADPMWMQDLAVSRVLMEAIPMPMDSFP
jgi:hypothetical protein